MSRNPRFAPCPGGLVEITHRTIQGRFLFKPSPRLDRIVLGVVGRAQERTQARIHGLVFLSNHFHILASFDSLDHQAKFMAFVGGNLSKEIGLIHDWPGPMFSGRFEAIPVSAEEEAQVARLHYLFSQGCKEGLVGSPRDWPGIHSAVASSLGRDLEGVWVDRSAYCHARRRRRGQPARLEDFEHRQPVELTPLPCWSHLAPEVYRARIEEMIRRVEEETRRRHRQDGTRPLGARAIRRQHPHDSPRRSAQSSKPLFHAFRRSERNRLVGALGQFLVAYREAARRLASGSRTVLFPANCFPPRLPFSPPAAREGPVSIGH